eukprot:361760-Prymnesium_polylepis.1
MFKDGDARIDVDSFASGMDYTEMEAKGASTRVAKFHGWLSEGRLRLTRHDGERDGGSVMAEEVVRR